MNSFRKEAMLYIFEDNEAVIKMIIKGRSPTMRLVSRTHRVALDWLFDRNQFGPQDPNQIHWRQKNNSQTYWQRKMSHVMTGTIFCVCSTLASWAPSTAPKRCRKQQKKMQVQEESQQKQSRWRIWYRDAVSGIRPCLPRLHLKTQGNTKSESQKVPLSSLNVQQTGTGRPVRLASSSKLLRMEQWRQVVFSSEEIWWNVENKYGETCI